MGKMKNYGNSLNRKIIASPETLNFTVSRNSGGTKKAKKEVVWPNELVLKIMSFVPQYRIEFVVVNKIWYELCFTSVHLKAYLKGILGVKIASNARDAQLLDLIIELATMKKSACYIGPRQWAEHPKKNGVSVLDPDDIPVFPADAAAQIQETREELQDIDPYNDVRLIWIPSSIYGEDFTLLEMFDILKRSNQFSGLQGIENLDDMSDEHPDELSDEDSDVYYGEWLELQQELKKESVAFRANQESKWCLISEKIIEGSVEKSYFDQLMLVSGSKKLSDVWKRQDIVNWHIYFRYSDREGDYVDGKITSIEKNSITIKGINEGNIMLKMRLSDRWFGVINTENRAIKIPSALVVVNKTYWAPNLLELFTLLLMSYGNNGICLLSEFYSRTTDWGRQGALEVGMFGERGLGVANEAKDRQDCETGLLMVRKLRFSKS